MRITPELITEIKDNEVFIFGSNLSGIHGGGAAKTAMKWGAEYYNPDGLQGKTYAIPTKDKFIRNALSIVEIKKYVDIFITFVNDNKNLNFYVTEIGTGLSGLKHKDIAPLFENLIDCDNVWLPLKFIEIIKE